jgi:transcription elongation GreA/GreB family factor
MCHDVARPEIVFFIIPPLAPTFASVSKSRVLHLIIATLSAELDSISRAAKDAFAAATDPDSKAENKYDTRSLEASYVARGQAQRVEELQEAVRNFQALAGRPSSTDEAISMGSLISLQGAHGTLHYFLGPAAGGTEVIDQGQEVMVITPSSPMGQKLLGKQSGDKINLLAGQGEAVISSVQ